jgi:hypothetical protein
VKVGTYHPVGHLTWIHREGSEETDDAIAKDSSREGCEYGSCGVNFGVIEKLEGVSFPMRTIGKDLTRWTAKLSTEVLPHEALKAIILAVTCYSRQIGDEGLMTCP